MQHALLNSLPSWEFLVLVVFVMSFFSVAFFLFIKHFLPASVHHQRNTFLYTLIQIMAINYAFLLGFIVITLWQGLDRAKKVTAAEANSLSLMTVNTFALPDQIQTRIQNTIGQYIQNIVNDEWETMKWGKESQPTFLSRLDLVKAVQSYNPETQTEKEFYHEIINNLNNAYENRRIRLDSLRSSLIPSFRFILIFNGFIIILLISLLENKEKNMHLFLTFLVACVLFFNIGLSLLFEYPFSGDLISNKPFLEGLLSRYRM